MKESCFQYEKKSHLCDEIREDIRSGHLDSKNSTFDETGFRVVPWKKLLGTTLKV